MLAPLEEADVEAGVPLDEAMCLSSWHRPVKTPTLLLKEIKALALIGDKKASLPLKEVVAPAPLEEAVATTPLVEG